MAAKNNFFRPIGPIDNPILLSANNAWVTASRFSHVHSIPLYEYSYSQLCARRRDDRHKPTGDGKLKVEDYMRLVKQSLERKDQLVGINGCEHSWPCFGKPAIIFHDRGKIFFEERRRKVSTDIP